MTCNEIRQQFSAYLDGELPADQAADVREHLAKCPDCAREYRLIASTWEMLLADEDVEPSADFARNFWQRIRHEQAAPADRPRPAFAASYRRLKWAPAIAAGLAIAFLGGWFTAGGPSPGDAKRAADVAFFRDYDVIQQMELLEDLPLLQADDAANGQEAANE